MAKSSSKRRPRATAKSSAKKTRPGKKSAAKAVARRTKTRRATPKAAKRAAASRPGRANARSKATAKTARASQRPKSARSTSQAKKKPNASKQKTQLTKKVAAAPKRAPAKRPKPVAAPAVEAERVASIPSSLTYPATATAARSGARELRSTRAKHTDTSPALTSGDIDASWEEASSTGDEAPGGDNLTPDQDVVEEISSALGIEYADDEELEGGAELERRDRHRWEYDPASAEDYVDRLKDE